MGCGFSDFLIRNLVASPQTQGVCEVGVHGFGVEILDGGNFERGNMLQLVRKDRDFDASFSGDNVLACNPGARIAGEFEQLRLVIQDPTLSDTVKVKIITSPLATWVDAEPSGKARTKWLARGRQALNPVTGLLVYDSGVLGEPDRFSAAEQLEVFNYWAGYIAGRRTFTTYVQVRPYNVAGATFQILQTFASKNYSLLPAGYSGALPTGPAFSMDWTTEGAGVTGQLARYPIGQVQVFITNDDGGNAGTYTWMIGTRSI